MAAAGSAVAGCGLLGWSLILAAPSWPVMAFGFLFLAVALRLVHLSVALLGAWAAFRRAERRLLRHVDGDGP